MKFLFGSLQRLRIYIETPFTLITTDINDILAESRGGYVQKGERNDR